MKNSLENTLKNKLNHTNKHNLILRKRKHTPHEANPCHEKKRELNKIREFLEWVKIPLGKLKAHKINHYAKPGKFKAIK
jgi:hypothetical protein